jgi:uncharacterized membrane protein
VNKAQYIQLFKEQLKGLPERDLEELIYDYEEHFTIGLSEGRSEAEIADSLGNPKTLAKEMKANYRISIVEETFTFNNFYRALFALYIRTFYRNCSFIICDICVGNCDYWQWTLCHYSVLFAYAIS